MLEFDVDLSNNERLSINYYYYYYYILQKLEYFAGEKQTLNVLLSESVIRIFIIFFIVPPSCSTLATPMG